MAPQPAGDTDEVVVFSSDDSEIIDSCSLVLSARSIPQRIGTGSGSKSFIAVQSPFAETAHHQITLFFNENMHWPADRPPLPGPQFQAGPATLGLIGTLFLFFIFVTGPFSGSSTWFASGAVNADAILSNGQWYRLVTALTLHADISHLAGNCLIGGFLCYYFLQIHGPGIGTMAILTAAAAANAFNVAAHGGDHISVGFSTAVFSIVGMLSIHQAIEIKQPFGIRMLVPLLGGAGLLAMLGSSGAQTDLGAHFFGLLAGLVVGLSISSTPFKKLRFIKNFQRITFIISLLTIVLCWTAALLPPGN